MLLDGNMVCGAICAPLPTHRIARRSDRRRIAGSATCSLEALRELGVAEARRVEVAKARADVERLQVEPGPCREALLRRATGRCRRTRWSSAADREARRPGPGPPPAGGAVPVRHPAARSIAAGRLPQRPGRDDSRTTASSAATAHVGLSQLVDPTLMSKSAPISFCSGCGRLRMPCHARRKALDGVGRAHQQRPAPVPSAGSPLPLLGRRWQEALERAPLAVAARSARRRQPRARSAPRPRRPRCWA